MLEMKRSDTIAANATELRRLIRSGVLAGTFLILLVFLPDFVPSLAHLLRPSRTCVPGVECVGEAIKVTVWQIRWPCAALGALTILWGGALAVMTRPSRESNGTDLTALISPHDSANGLGPIEQDTGFGMSAKAIASQLRGPWTTEASGCAYSTPQRRVRIAIETNGDWDALRYERRDPNEDCEEFAHDLLAIIGDDLCARDQLALIRALAERLTAWQARRGCEDDPVRHCLEELLNPHRQTTLK